jgi:hypothetical protein
MIVEKKQPLLPVNGFSLATGKGRSRRSGGRMKKGSGVPALPPQLETVLSVKHTFRFETTAAVTATNVTIGNVISVCGGVGTIANSQISMWASSVRVISITVWPGLSSTEVNPEVIWQSAGTTQAKDASKSRSIPGGVTMDRAVVSRPPAGSLARLWQLSSNSSSVLFQLTAPAQSIVDVKIAFTLANNYGGLNVMGYAAVTLGTIYYSRLDSVGGKCVPVGVPTTN